MWGRYEKSEVIRNTKSKNDKRISTKTEAALTKLKLYPYSRPVNSPDIKLIRRGNKFLKNKNTQSLKYVCVAPPVLSHLL